MTCCTFERIPLFACDLIATCAQVQLLRTAGEHEIALLAYCFMPDHLHALVEGMTARADFRLFMTIFRRRSSRHCRSGSAARLWQRGYHDRVLRQHQPTEPFVAYIVRNPVRAGLVSSVGEYRYSWAERWPTPVGQRGGVAERSSV